MSNSGNDYQFRLTPYTGFVKELCYVNSNDFSIYDDSDSSIGVTDLHILSSPHLNDIDDVNILKAKLKGLLMILNGSLSITLGFERFATYGSLSVDYSEGVAFSDLHTDISSIDLVQLNPFNPKRKYEIHPRANEFSALINIASYDEKLRIVLGMCGLGFDWVNLYRIWETIRYYTRLEYNQGNMSLNHSYKRLQNDKLMNLAYSIDEKEISRFTGTVNSFELLGYSARHGAGGGLISNPMTRVEASNLVHSAAVGFSNHFFSRSGKAFSL